MSEELQVVPIEEQISQELVKHNVTQAVISTLNEKYGHLKIAGIEDKETYLLVKEGRKECKAFRVAAKKICEKGREEAVAIQKAWVAKQKEVTDQIAAIEDPLEEQEKAYEAAVAKDKADRQRRQEEQLILRQQVLTGMGVLYSGGSFILGEVAFELSLVKESEQDIWEESILPKFKEEYEKVEAERIELERVKQEHEAEMNRQREELERKQKELEQKEAELKLAKEEQERKQKEEDAKKAAEEAARIERLWRSRLEQLNPIGWNGQEAFARYDESVIVATYKELIEMDEGTFATVLNIHHDKVADDAKQKEQKRLAEIEEQKEKQRIADLRRHRCDLLIQYGVSDHHEDVAKYNDEQWASLLENVKGAYEEQQRLKWEAEQEEKRKQDELIRLQKLDAAKDKEKWEEMMQKINEVVVYEMRSSQYRKKAMILREKLEEIKAL